MTEVISTPGVQPSPGFAAPRAMNRPQPDGTPAQPVQQKAVSNNTSAPLVVNSPRMIQTKVGLRRAAPTQIIPSVAPKPLVDKPVSKNPPAKPPMPQPARTSVPPPRTTAKTTARSAVSNYTHQNRSNVHG
jgi:hypothetical protein